MKNSVSEDRQEPDRRDKRYLTLVLGRHQGDSDEKVAAIEGFEPAKALYQQLAVDGYPICGTCGKLHVSRDHCESKPQRKERRARLGGKEGKELPPAARAAGLFRAALEVFERDIDSLERRQER